MTNPVLRNLLVEKIDLAIRSAAAVGDVSHLGQRGKAREIFVKNLLEPFLLPGQIARTGAVVDSQGNESGQSDIIVFDKSILPPELFDETDGLFPIEACAYVIEVKSRLTSQELQDSIAKGKRLLNLKPLVNGCRPVHVVFAFQSDLVGNEMLSELKRYIKLDPHRHEVPAVPVICVASKGYACLNARDETKWNYMDSDSHFSGVANFVGGFANTLPDFRKDRILNQIRYGQYLLDPFDFKQFPQISS